ncbi:PAS and helix-turn-helix domain-containing protein [Rhizobium sp. CSW-27]|uniref:PAS and helix-turn-helix domain-containing protein n=1 Tax=Rhizobium sp. CSW-27 TaxID=2839985 RepID=UPI001C0173CB|nr:PAS and helix-turn-helix domain-containing protein [Rhizobium sp. CSW-27]MBT9372730.1 PAS and helix-turn-helix domain-containing protein [Rhizobium sp. CSW-27]
MAEDRPITETTRKDTSPRFSLHELPVPMVYATHRIIRDCNAPFAELFGYRQPDLVGQSFAILYPKISDFIRTGKMWREHLPGSRSYYDERIMMTLTGQRFWCQVTGRSFQHDDPFAHALYCFQRLNRPVNAHQLSLTGRQYQILTLVSQGKTNGEIAAELKLSRRTVESHRARLMKITGSMNSAQLMSWFVQQS